MAGEIPSWLIGQTTADFDTLGKALHRVESDHRDTAPWRVAGNLSAARRALRCLEQDLRYVREFNDGEIRRQGGSVR